MISCCL